MSKLIGAVRLPPMGFFFIALEYHTSQDPLEDLTARLQRLVAETTKEKDPVKYDERCAELWRELRERDAAKEALRIARPETESKKNISERCKTELTFKNTTQGLRSRLVHPAYHDACEP